ncbi:MAG: hypothetical protein WC876_09775, partial [Candidatus Thermoplasmatota archaeon]
PPFNGTSDSAGSFQVFHGNGTGGGLSGDRFIVEARLGWPFWLHHILVISALAIVAYAYVRPSSLESGAAALAAVPFFLVSNAVLQSAEALLALVPTVMSVINWRQRRTKGSLQVAVGFGLLAVAHLAFVGVLFLRPPVIIPFFDVLALAGIATLVFAVPRGP